MLLTHRILVLWLFLVSCVANAAPTRVGVSFGGAYLDPPAFWQKKPHQPHDQKLKAAFDAVMLVGGRATAVVISKDGLAITAHHVIADLYSQPTKDCSRIPLFLKHELNAAGEKDAELERVTCDEIIVSEYPDDFVLMKLKPRKSGKPYPFAKILTNPAKIRVGQKALIVGHPHALSYDKGVKKISSGPIVLYAPEHAELPHFLHLIDTEGGSSGAPVMLADGTVIGLHFRGVPQYGDGVEVTVDGVNKKIHSFNVALPLPYLFHKYKKSFYRKAYRR